MSQCLLPDRMKEEAERKTERYLKFFQTPEQQLMPLGIWAMVDDMQNVELLRQFGRSGVNMVHRYGSRQTPPRAFADLDAAADAGIGVLQNLPSGYLMSKNLGWWRDHIRTLAEHGQILVWYLPEERKKPEEMERVRGIGNIIREIDGKDRAIFTYVEEAEREYLRRSGSYVDGLIFGAYPSYYSPRPRIDLRRRIDLAYSSGVPSVLGAVEAVKDAEPGERWPAMGATLPEYVRTDGYIALISGAKGLMWYCWAQAREVPGLKDAIRDLARELNGPLRIGEVFLRGEIVEGIECRLISGARYGPPASAYENRTTNLRFLYSSVQWIARRHREHLYIIGVNVNEKVRAADHGGKDYAVKVRFDLPEKYTIEDRVEVLKEDRTIDVVDGSFVDEFMPLEVHVYRVKLQ